MSVPEEQPQDLVEALDVPHRFQLAYEWVKSARLLAETTQDPDALKAWKFINERTTIGVPMPGGSIHYFFTEKPDRPVEEYAFLAPLLKEDATRLPEDDFRHQMVSDGYKHAAEYRENSRAIYLPPAPLGEKGRGVLLLHESLHAWLDIDKLVDRSAPNAHWFEEAQVYIFEFKLLSGLLGPKYDTLVEQIRNAITAHPDDAGSLKSTYVFTSQDKDFVASGMRTVSDKETRLWLGVMQLQADWEYHKLHSKDPDVELAKYLKALQGRDTA